MKSNLYPDMKGKIDVLLELDNLFYGFMVLCICISALLHKEKKIYFILLCILGCGLVSLLVESQGRYKYSIEPLWTVPTAYVLSHIMKKVKG